jgi:hypothetical protein
VDQKTHRVYGVVKRRETHLCARGRHGGPARHFRQIFAHFQRNTEDPRRESDRREDFY